MLIVANWKAYVETEDKAKKLFAAAKKLAVRPDTEIVLAVPAPYLGLFALSNHSKVAFAAQDISAGIGGAATGEIIAPLLRNINVGYAILGHSERRAMGETDAIVSEKVRHALANKITPIVCIGERERDADAKYLSVLRAQLKAVFEPLSPKERQQVILAYEPIWAIGKTAADALAPSELHEMVLYIRKILADYLPGKTTSKVRLIYGGSVEPGNIRLLAQGTGIEGFLPGHASADVDMFTALVKAIQ